MHIQVNASVTLQPLDATHAAPLLALVDANRAHLRTWLPWVDMMQTEADFDRFIAASQLRRDAGSEQPWVILYNGDLAGRIGIYYINGYNQSGALGYWLGRAFTGKGIVTAACRAFTTYCFDQLQMNRVEIKCGTGNLKSQAIPEKLGFTKEGVIRQGEKLYDGFIDLYCYSMLKSEWPAATQG